MTQSPTLPLCAGRTEAPIARHEGRWISRAALLAQAEALAASFPSGGYGLNLCRNRYHFIVSFAALLLAGRVNLLPHSAAPQVIDELAAEYGAFRVEDEAVAGLRAVKTSTAAIPAVPAEHEAAILFTSGSTGRPGAQGKTWGELVGAARVAIERFGLAKSRHDIVATVPAQHSYGLESSVLYALCGPAVVHAAHPLFPADVQDALADMAAPRILVTTPLHLEACLQAGLGWPPLALTLSATAALKRDTAAAAETAFGAPLMEIYGSSESGAIASRRTLETSLWTPYKGMRLTQTGERFHVQAPFFPAPRALSDRFELCDHGDFEWLGRDAEQIKIAGKRTTLAELNARLLAIPGVDDGGFVLPEADAERVAAVVVAPTLTLKQIREALRAGLDPVFLPRPLVKATALRHTATGKLARAELLAQLAKART